MIELMMVDTVKGQLGNKLGLIFIKNFKHFVSTLKFPTNSNEYIPIVKTAGIIQINNAKNIYSKLAVFTKISFNLISIKYFSLLKFLMITEACIGCL